MIKGFYLLPEDLIMKGLRILEVEGLVQVKKKKIN